MRFALLQGTCCAGVAALSLSAAMAQEAVSEDTTVTETQAQATKLWQPLADDGITIALSYTGEAATNVTGG